MIFLLLISSTSCMDKFLEEDVYSGIAPSNFYKSQQDAIATVTAVYNNFQVYGNEWWNTGLPFMNVTDAMTDIMFAHWFASMENLTFTSGESDILNLWNWTYNSINKENLALEKLPEIEMNDELRSRLMAEIRFLRALSYFYAVQFWGDLPLILNSIQGFNDIQEVSRDSETEIYAQIISDLNEAIPALPLSYDVENAGRATKGAAKALLGKVYLTRGWGGKPENINTSDLQAALSEFEDLMQAPFTYKLAENIEDVFEYTKENRPDLGHIFSIQYSQGLGFEGTWLAQNMQAMELENAWWGYSAPESWVQGPDGYEIFWQDGWNPVPVDKRLDRLWEDYTQLWWFYWCKKWQYDNYLGWAEHPQNMTLIRYADILLMHSEILNELNASPNEQVVASINLVRERAGVEPYMPAEWTKETFRDEIQDERNRELWGEGHSWFDYVRKGMFVDRMQATGMTNVTEKFNLLPVPKQELDNNPNLTQNPGW
jgi:starch-binding outer membrane protein, SusD/RagB family